MRPTAINSFSPARIVEASILEALRDGERLVVIARVVASLALAATWPLTLWLEPAIAARQRVLAVAGLVVAALSAASSLWLKRHSPGWRFSLLSILLDASLTTSILLVIMLWGGPWYRGLPTVVGTPAVGLVVALAGLRLSPRLAAAGIVIGWLLTAGLIAVDAARHPGPYPASLANVLGVGINLLGASVIGWAFNSRTRKWIDEAASLAALASRAAQRLGAYLPREVAEATLVAEVLSREAERVEAAVLFTRLEPLSSTTDLDGRQVVDELNEYFRAVTPAVQAAGGVIDKYRHDGVMAVFGAATPTRDAARHAILAAEMMSAALDRLDAQRRGDGLEPLRHAVGIHVGPVALGNVGTAERVAHTVVGDAVNVAARIASLAGGLGETILLTEATVEAARGDRDGDGLPPIRDLGDHALRGRRSGVRLFATDRRSGTLPPPPSAPARASWDQAPRTEIISGRYAQPSLETARAQARTKGSIVESVLDQAAIDAERWVARVRLGVGVAGLTLSPLLTASDSRRVGSIAFAVIGSVAIATSLVILRALGRRMAGSPSRARWALGALPIALDVTLVGGVLAASMIWHSPRYENLSHVVALGLIYLVILTAGLRLKRRKVLLATALASAAIVALFTIDRALGHPLTPLEIASVMILIGGSALIADAAVVRSKRLVTAVVEQTRDAARARARLGAYASEAVAEHALDRDRIELGGRRLDQVAVVACDLRGFTAYAEDMPPEDLVSQLNDYFEAMAEPIREQRGVIDSFVGDALLVVFGAPEPRPRAALRALRAAVGMHRALESHNAERARRGLPPLMHGIGVHVGTGVAGHIGTTERATFAVVGPVMTDAEALESATKHQSHPVVASAAAVEAAKRQAEDDEELPPCHPIGSIELGPGGGTKPSRSIEAHALG